MNYLGISAGFHDAAISLIDDAGRILFAGHSERYSGRKHDPDLCPELIQDAQRYISSSHVRLNYHERPLVKWFRQLRQGQWHWPPSLEKTLGPENWLALGNIDSTGSRVRTHRHHLSHAAAGFQTSPFREACVVVIDSIGEWDTITIWSAHYDNRERAQYRLLWRQTYPDSIGLFYSAWTQRLGLKPLDEEYILMGMAAWGKPVAVAEISRDQIQDLTPSFHDNLHTGISPDYLPYENSFDLAASVQSITEIMIERVLTRARELSMSDNLVYAGGVALNCTANRLLGRDFSKLWIMPCPGDAGNSLGAAALDYGRALQWQGVDLGYDIAGHYPVSATVQALLEHKIVGLAAGRAEFGPRALGYRSLLADPRGPDIKARVNTIKQRQQFRPFAPMILSELAPRYFTMPRGWDQSPYMQTVAVCRVPSEFPAIVHVDNTSRVQTVPPGDTGPRRLLEAWYRQTGCPMLLNTSLNIRGQPMVNTRTDAAAWIREYDTPVVTP